MQSMKLAFLFSLFLSLQSQAQDLAFSKEWLQLLHMRKTLLGNYESSVRGEGFFISPEGSNNPLAEYQATEKAMFGSDPKLAKQIQCSFLARRDFFLRHGPPEYQEQIQKCEFSEDWLKRLNSTKMTLVFASAYLSSAPSSFGHTFLKLQNPQNEQGKDLLNYGINFAARTDQAEGALYALYGLTGVFPGSFAMLPYHQMIKDYTHLEGRDLWEYELNLTEEEVRRILYHLLELDRVYFEYYFLDDNCSYALLKLLEIGRPGLELVDEEEFFVIPLDTVKVAMPLVSEIHYRPSIATEWQQRQKTLSKEQNDQLLSLHEKTSLEDLQKLDTETLTAAQYFVSLKSYENQAQWRDLNFLISRERAKRGKEQIPFQVERPKTSPDQSPHSSAVELGFLDHQKSSGLFGFRFAFHDQLSRNEGVSPFSHLEVLSFQLQFQTLDQILIRHYRLLETISTESISAYEKPTSWGFSAGGNATPLAPTRLRNQITGRLGYSFDFWPQRVRWANFLVAGAQQDLDSNYQLTPGVDSRLWILWTPGIRSLAQYESFRFPSFLQQSVKVAQAFDLTRQLELRIGWRDFLENEQNLVEKSVSLHQNFLF